MKKLTMIIIAALILSACNSKKETNNELKDLEKKYNAKVGVSVINTKNDKAFNYNADERFAYASTFKTIISSILLEKYTYSQLNKEIQISKEDIVEHSPILENYVGKKITIKKLVEAMMLHSDNTAFNKSLEEIGGYKTVKRKLNSLGDNKTNPVRKETELNFYNPNNEKDTSTPKSYAKTIDKLINEGGMEKKNKDILIKLMKENGKKDSLIKNGVPDKFEIAEKSGQGTTYASRNDIAFIYPKNQSEPIVLVIFTNKKSKDSQPNDKLISETAKLVLKDY